MTALIHNWYMAAWHLIDTTTAATAMNVIMLVDNNNSYHHKSRVLPKAPKESSRSKSPRAKKEHSRSKSLSRRDDHHSSGGLKHHLSSSTHHLTQKAQEEFEIPVIVDDVTKWISGVNKNTTCRDIITVILRRNNQQFKVSPSPVQLKSSFSSN